MSQRRHLWSGIKEYFLCCSRKLKAMILQRIKRMVQVSTAENHIITIL